MGKGAGPGEVIDKPLCLSYPIFPCSGISRGCSPPQSHPLAVGLVLAAVDVSFLLLFVPGQVRKALGRKEGET